MIRHLITIAIPLLAPVALYLLYSWHLQRKGGQTGDDPFSWKEIPWIWLIVAGLTLMSATLLASTFISRNPDAKQYEPPRFEDGKRIPSTFAK